jgi:dihydroxyacetone kinase-like protein
MKKFINKPEDFVPEMLQGLYSAFPKYVTYTADDVHCLVIANKHKGKVGIATGGGSGHLPLFLGYVGEGMLDGCAVGDVFQSPSSDQMLNVTKEIDQGAGVLYIFGNYNGDKFNFQMAADSADMECNIRVNQVIVGEDVASGKRVSGNEQNLRRGVAGIFFVYKCAGAAASEMLSLDEVTRVAEKAKERIATMGVALSPCTVPRIGKPSFEIADDEMEIGMGIHGEPGIRRGKILTANEVVEEILPPVIEDLALKENDEVDVLVNGLGATPLEEQLIIFHRASQLLAEKGIRVHETYVGEFATSLEMAGLSISLFKLDDELKKYMSAAADTPFFKKVKK